MLGYRATLWSHTGDLCMRGVYCGWLNPAEYTLWMFCCQIMRECWGPTSPRGTAKIRHTSAQNHWWMYQCRCVPIQGGFPPFMVGSHLEPVNQLSCVFSTRIVIAFSSGSQSPCVSLLGHKCSSGCLSSLHGRWNQNNDHWRKAGDVTIQWTVTVDSVIQPL